MTEYVPPYIETYTTNRSITLTKEEVEKLREILDTLPASVQEKINRL